MNYLAKNFYKGKCELNGEGEGGGRRRKWNSAQGGVMQSSDMLLPSRGSAGIFFFFTSTEAGSLELSGFFRIACDGSGSCSFCICPKE